MGSMVNPWSNWRKNPALWVHRSYGVTSSPDPTVTRLLATGLREIASPRIYQMSSWDVRTFHFISTLSSEQPWGTAVLPNVLCLSGQAKQRRSAATALPHLLDKITFEYMWTLINPQYIPQGAFSFSNYFFIHQARPQNTHLTACVE